MSLKESRTAPAPSHPGPFQNHTSQTGLVPETEPELAPTSRKPSAYTTHHLTLLRLGIGRGTVSDRGKGATGRQQRCTCVVVLQPLVAACSGCARGNLLGLVPALYSGTGGRQGNPSSFGVQPGPFCGLTEVCVKKGGGETGGGGGSSRVDPHPVSPCRTSSPFSDTLWLCASDPA